ESLARSESPALSLSLVVGLRACLCGVWRPDAPRDADVLPLRSLLALVRAGRALCRMDVPGDVRNRSGRRTARTETLGQLVRGRDPHGHDRRARGGRMNRRPRLGIVAYEYPPLIGG